MISLISQELKSQGFKRALLITSEDFIDKSKFMIWFYEEKILSDKSLALAKDFEEENKIKAMIPSNETIEKLKEIKYNKLLPFIKENGYKIKVNIVKFNSEDLKINKKTIKKIEKIAIENFDNIRTLKTRQISDLNFHEIPIWSLKKALIKCYQLGFEEGKKSIKEKNKGSE